MRMGEKAGVVQGLMKCGLRSRWRTNQKVERVLWEYAPRFHQAPYRSPDRREVVLKCRCALERVGSFGRKEIDVRKALRVRFRKAAGMPAEIDPDAPASEPQPAVKEIQDSPTKTEEFGTGNDFGSHDHDEFIYYDDEDFDGVY
jgi:hypothetical protein